ncbi:MAG: DUF6541 family protein [Candidatus Micrarchaeia archaeon]
MKQTKTAGKSSFEEKIALAAILAIMAAFMLAIFSSPEVSEIERFYLKDTEDFIYEMNYQPAVFLRRLYSSGNARFEATFVNPEKETEKFMLMVTSSKGDYEKAYPITLENQAPGKNYRFIKNFTVEPVRRKLFGEYDLRISMVKLSKENSSRIEKQIYQKTAAIKATPAGFLGLRAPLSENPPFLPPRAILFILILAFALSFLHEKILKIWQTNRQLLVLAFLAMFCLPFIFAYVTVASTTHTAIGGLDASRNALNLQNIITTEKGEESITIYNDIWESAYSSFGYSLLIPFNLLASENVLTGSATFIPILIFFLIPLALFTFAYLISKDFLASFIATFSFIFASKTLPWIMDFGTWNEALNLFFLLAGIGLLYKFHETAKKHFLALGLLLAFIAALAHPAGLLLTAVPLALFFGLLALHKLLEKPSIDTFVRIGAATIAIVLVFSLVIFTKNEITQTQTDLSVVKLYLENVSNVELNPFKVLEQDAWNDPLIFLLAFFGLFSLGVQKLKQFKWQFPALLNLTFFAVISVATGSGIGDNYLGYNRIFHYIAIFSAPFAGFFIASLARKAFAFTKKMLEKTQWSKNSKKAASFAFVLILLVFSLYAAFVSPTIHFSPYGEYSAIDVVHEHLSIRTNPAIWPYYLSTQLAYENAEKLKKEGVSLLLTRSKIGTYPNFQAVDAYCMDLALASGGLDCYNLCSNDKNCADEDLEELVRKAGLEHPYEKKAVLTKETLPFELLDKLESQGNKYNLYLVP